jgi:parvulin-like peptidyl-prolyl isomerase
MTRLRGSDRRFLALLAACSLAGVLLAGCGKKSSPTLVTTGSRTLTVADFEAYARRSEVVQPYLSLPESAQKRALFDDVLAYEVLAEAAIRKGFDKDTAYTKIDTDLLPRILPDALYDKRIGDVAKVSESEAKLYFDAPKNEYQLALIMVTDTTLMPSLVARLDRGEAFEEVARTGSQDPETASNGGRVQNWVTLGQLPSPFEQAVAPLKKGERSKPVTQRTGSYVFKVLDVRPHQNAQPWDVAKADVIRMLENKKRGELAEKYLSGLKDKAHVKIEGPGWEVVDGPLVAVPDSLELFLATDPTKAGLTSDQLSQVLGTWLERKYTVTDLLHDIAAAPMNERPPSTRSDLMRQFVEGKAMSDILIAEAKKEGLDESPEVERQLSQAKTAFLVQKYIESLPRPVPIAPPTPAMLDSITQQMVNAMGAPNASAIHFKNLPPVVQQQIVSQWQNEQMQKRQQDRLKSEVERLKAEIKPVINEEALKSIPWPLPPEDGEKA